MFLNGRADFFPSANVAERRADANPARSVLQAFHSPASCGAIELRISRMRLLSQTAQSIIAQHSLQPYLASSGPRLRVHQMCWGLLFDFLLLGLLG